MENDRKHIDPLNDLLEKDFPIIVLVDDCRSFIGWGIKHHTNGNYCHSMVMIARGRAVSQNLTLKDIPLSKYMLPSCILKFWTYENMTKVQRVSIMAAIKTDLARPWYRRFYDFLGIAGQLFNVRWIQTPGLNYCSENVAKYLRAIPELKGLSVRPSPVDLNVFFNKTPGFKCLGYWWED